MADDQDGANDEALIAYVRGRLPDAEAARIATEAARHPDLAAEIALIRGIAAAVDAEGNTPSPGELGWARLSRVLETEAPRSGLRARRNLWPLAASAAAAVLAWQLIAVPLISGPGGQEAGYAPVSELRASGSTLSVAFAPTATEEAIRALLQEIDAWISDGPSAIGLWQLSFENDALRDSGLARLRAADIVESAQ